MVFESILVAETPGRSHDLRRPIHPSLTSQEGLCRGVGGGNGHQCGSWILAWLPQPAALRGSYLARPECSLHYLRRNSRFSRAHGPPSTQPAACTWIRLLDSPMTARPTRWCDRRRRRLRSQMDSTMAARPNKYTIKRQSCGKIQEAAPTSSPAPKARQALMRLFDPRHPTPPTSTNGLVTERRDELKWLARVRFRLV